MQPDWHPLLSPHACLHESLPSSHIQLLPCCDFPLPQPATSVRFQRGPHAGACRCNSAPTLNPFPFLRTGTSLPSNSPPANTGGERQ